ncbi:MAG: ISNCY family transposase [Cyclobacteriaceae bacterium]|nr:ISNCY family transposase [Cyclobacteriaceae bacterium]
MRKRFEQQISLGQTPISEVKIMTKTRDALPALLHALQKLFITPEYNEKLFSILEDKILKNKKQTGRTGMDLWWIFVLAEVRLCCDLSYDRLHYMANYDSMLRKIMGVEVNYGIPEKKFEYQNILDNVSLLDDQTVRQINEVIVSFGHEVFKKKDENQSFLADTSYVLESNVHFPTDYNLLWDSARKCLDVKKYFIKKHKIKGWGKIKSWRKDLKGLMRAVGKASSSGGKNKFDRQYEAASRYLEKASALLVKVVESKSGLPINSLMDLAQLIALEYYIKMLEKHIDLVDRRLLQGEIIPHEEKVFSIFETYTEWIKKGKLHPNVELGKRILVSTDQYNLMLDYQVMDEVSDNEVVEELAGRILKKHCVQSWSFDRGFSSKINKELLKEGVRQVIMPKKGKCNKAEKAEESASLFKKLKNQHSAVESNINELEHRGLNRCPDRGYNNFKRYVGLGVCAYNLKKIGKKLIEIAKEKEIQKRKRLRICA